MKTDELIRALAADTDGIDGVEDARIDIDHAARRHLQLQLRQGAPRLRIVSTG